MGYDIEKKDFLNNFIALNDTLKLRTHFFAEKGIGAYLNFESDIYLDDYKQFCYPLSIPVDFLNKYELLDPEQDLIKNPQPWVYYSPIVPTNEKDIYFVQKISSVELRDKTGLMGRGINQTLIFYRLSNGELIEKERELNNIYMTVFK